MKTKIQKWGDSYGIIIPSNMLKSLDIKTNDIVKLVQEKDRIIISKPKKRHLSLEERFQMFKNLPDNEKEM